MSARQTTLVPTAEAAVSTDDAAVVLDDLLRRVRAEFLEMPGLRVTRAQARRLWALDADACDAVLMALVDAQFLVESRNASFMRRAT